MSLTSSCNQICNSPLNNSPTKMMYSFSKASRFPRYQKSFSTSAIYNLPSLKITRGTSLGYGVKFDFFKEARKNTAGFYNLKSDFDKTNPHGPSFTFGVGREKMLAKKELNTPGPGKYVVSKMFGSNAPKIAIKGHKIESTTNKYSYNTPAPNAYNFNYEMNPEGKFWCSKYKNVVSCDFGSNRDERFKYKVKEGPSPAEYSLYGLNGSIFESRFRSNPAYSMRMRLHKSVDSRNFFPGPGAYNAFSIFGSCYDKKSSNYLQLRKTLKLNGKMNYKRALNNSIDVGKYNYKNLSQSIEKI